MVEAEQVSALIGDIYDASLDPALWPFLTASFMNSADATPPTKFAELSRTSAHNTVYTWGYDPNYVQRHLEYG